MGCCGDKRTTLMSTPAPAARPAPAQPVPVARQPAGNGGHSPQQEGFDSSPVNSGVVLRYLENSPILVRGPVSGRQYQFSGSHPDQVVDARDVESLLRTRFFRRSF